MEESPEENSSDESESDEDKKKKSTKLEIPKSILKKLTKAQFDELTDMKVPDLKKRLEYHNLIFEF
jgi:hypothetical protein